MSAAVWPPAGSLVIPPPCICKNRPKPKRVRTPRKDYIDLNSRPVFLKPSETADFTPEELCEYRKSWAVR
jgi:hypothetical protein